LRLSETCDTPHRAAVDRIPYLSAKEGVREAVPSPAGHVHVPCAGGGAESRAIEANRIIEELTEYLRS
jgi:hypothetical protein